MIRLAKDMEVEVRDRMRGGPGSVAIRHFFSKDEISAKTRLCAELTIPPGAGIGTHDHATEDEVYIVISGTGLIEEGKFKTRVRAGDAVLTGKGGSHAVFNDGSEDLRIIAVIMCY
jgi:mannose-6-phosphate isomerase-like protein (cupin superfamily)